MTTEYLLAGFGGQGVLFAGKFLAYLGLTKGKEVSWLPSYGPEMRGGTANCSVIVSDDPVGSPIVGAPDVLLAMNLPSLDKFEGKVKPGGVIFVDSSLVARKVQRTDVTAVYVPGTQLASDSGALSLANITMMGKILAAENEEIVEKALDKSIDARRAGMVEQNMKAFRIGKGFE